jgi:arsenite methyltransferase
MTTWRKCSEKNKLDVHTDKIKEQIHGKRRPLHEFTDVLKNHSFMEENVSHDIFDYRFVDGTALFQHYFMRLAFLDGWKSIIPEKMQQHVFNCMEDKLNRKAEKDGFIKLTIPFVVINCIRK